jgi:hypothetical protein
MARSEDFLALPQVSVAASYTILPNDVVLLVSSAAPRTISTNAADQVAGRVLIIVDSTGAAGTNNITFDPAGAVTVNGAATALINSNRGVLRVICDGSNWFQF